ncbi:helix-turn-helix domain-containing protein [Kistimonas asteriae]|uniref:helix-turn-helix domain-containing protein n=1 Tax=Kistimonas asteriae TaxID=517724 RepID=UPI001BA642F9
MIDKDLNGHRDHRLGYSVREAAKRCGVSTEFLNKLRSQGAVNGVTGPQFIKIGRKVIYPCSDLDNWFNEFVKVRTLAELEQK